MSFVKIKKTFFQMKKLSIFLFFITFSVIGFSQTFKVFEYMSSENKNFSSIDGKILFNDDAIKLYNVNDELVLNVQINSMEKQTTGELLCTGKEQVLNELMSIEMTFGESKNIIIWRFNYKDGYSIFKTVELKEEATVSQDESFDKYKLFDSERDLVKRAFNAYIEFDTNDLNSVKNIDKVLSDNKNNVNRDEIVKEVKLLSLEALRLLEKDSLKQIMNLLENERDKFYLHPANNIDNELNLHSVSVLLYSIFYEPEDYYRQSLILGNRSLVHIEAVHTLNGQWSKNYPYVLMDIITANMELKNIDIAIINAEKLLKYYKEIGYDINNDSYFNTIKLLKLLYENSNNKEKAASFDKLLNSRN